MAEFCLECWNRINEKQDSSEKYILSSDLELCEGCGKQRHVIVKVKSPRLIHILIHKCKRNK